ncbi:MAG: helix-turn-helix domain-containing protein [Pseudomonadota bacterium]
MDLVLSDATQPAPRGKLSKEKIVAAAIAIAREDGLDSLSMRKVASRLKAGVMSIYHYIKNRDALLLAMLDQVALDLDHPAPCDDPAQEIVQIYSTLYAIFRDEPWLVETVTKTNLASVHVLPLVERIYAALEKMGLDDTEIGELFSVLIEYTYGRAITTYSEAAITEFGLESPFGDVSGAQEQYPVWFRVEENFRELPGSFERGLRRILGV